MTSVASHLVAVDQASAERDRYLAELDGFADRRRGADPGWIARLRRDAIALLSTLAFPTTQEEEWRYTSVAPLLRTAFRPALEPSRSALHVTDLAPFTLSQDSGIRLVFVNGFPAPNLSSTEPRPGGLRVTSLADALRSHGDLVEQHLARHASAGASAFTAMNTAFLGDGALVVLPDGGTIEEPIELVFVSTTRGEPVLSQPRTLILAGRGSRATVVETYVGLARHESLTNATTEVVLADAARLNHHKIAHESERGSHIATTSVVVGRDAAYTSSSISLSAQLLRNELRVLLDAEGTECTLDGLYLVGDHQLADNHTLIDHARPHGSSRELYKGILAGRARAVFSGKVVVRQDAQKTDTQQTNRNLLLSERAEVDTKPQLEIFADDVKCTHGAAIGPLERDAIFYLESRGMSDATARNVLTHGFAADVIERIRPPALRHRIDGLVATRLARLARDTTSGRSRP